MGNSVLKHSLHAVNRHSGLRGVLQVLAAHSRVGRRGCPTETCADTAPDSVRSRRRNYRPGSRPDGPPRRLVMPSALAFKVISLANSSSLPPMASATTTAASFADLVTSPLIASSTLMV